MPRTWAVILACAIPAVSAAADPPPDLRRAEELFAADRFAAAEPLYQAALASADRATRRLAYERLLALYVRSGRADRAVKLADPFRAWLKQIADAGGEAELDLLLGECHLTLGHLPTADKYLTSALAGPLAADRRLHALRARGEVARDRRDPDERKRWAELEAAARAAAATAETLNDARQRITAARFLADALDRRGDRPAALTVLAPLPALHDTADDPTGRRDTQRVRANLLAASAKFADAVPLFREALAFHRKFRPGRRLTAGDILADWAAAADAAGDRPEAARLRRRAVEEYTAVFTSPPDPENPTADGPLAAFTRAQQLHRSVRQFRDALALSRQVGERWSEDALLDARLKADRGGLELLAASYRQAREHLAAALAKLDAADPPDLRTVPQVLVNLATAELASGEPGRAESLLERCTALYDAHRLPPDPVRAECDHLRGAAAGQRGEFAAAVKCFREGLARCAAVGKPADPVRFNLLVNTALIHKEQGDTAAALASLKDAAGALASFAETGDLSFALIDAVRADLFVADGRVPAAAALVPGIEAACEANGVKGGYLWGTARHVRALGKLAGRDPAGAEAEWAELAAVQRAEGQAQLARTLNFLGVAAEVQNRHADAARRYAEARRMETERPRCHPATRAVTLWRLAVLADRDGRKDEAKKLLNDVFDVADRARLNTFGEAAQRAKFYAQFAPAFELLAGWYVRDNDPEGLLRVAARSRSRTLLDQVLSAGVDPRATIAGPDRDKLLAREAAARQAVSRLQAKAQYLNADRPDGDEARKLVADLDAAQAEFADAWREIVAANPVTRALTDTTFAERAAADVRRDILAGGGAELTYFAGRHAGFAVLADRPGAPPKVFPLAVSKALAEAAGDVPPLEPAEAGSLALRGVRVRTLHPQPDPPAAPPGPAVALTDAVAGRLVDNYLRQIADPGFTPTRGVSVVARQPQTAPIPVAADTLGDVFLPPALRQQLKAGGAKHLVVFPDGPLHKLPLESLLVSTPGGVKFALEELPAVTYAPSPAILAVIRARPRPTGEAAVLTVANPAYPEAVASAAGTPPTTRDAVTGFGPLPRLPFTADESRAIQKSFPPGVVTAIEGDQATEKHVAAAVAGKRVVHLAAHGFADTRFGNLFAAVALTPPPRGRETPDDDGFLSLHEIYRLPLAGCELTVLSACTTNVGPQQPLEAGVTLAGGFLCAGSRRVLATCWSVDDRATAALMGEFFRGVAGAGEKPAAYPDAMRAARLKVRRTPGWESPFYWAPFVFMGSPD